VHAENPVLRYKYSGEKTDSCSLLRQPGPPQLYLSMKSVWNCSTFDMYSSTPGHSAVTRM
jgi:hypothetical protein